MKRRGVADERAVVQTWYSKRSRIVCRRKRSEEVPENFFLFMPIAKEEETKGRRRVLD